MVASQVIEGLGRVDAELARGSDYETVMAALDEAARMDGADAAAFGIAQRRFTIALVYERSVVELEAALRELLAIDEDPISSARAAGAAYVTYPGLVSYFEKAVAELEARPRTPMIDAALESAAGVRARVAKERIDGVSSEGAAE